VSNELGGITINFDQVSGDEFNKVWYFAVLDRALKVSCSLHIRIDRSERPGSLFEHGGNNEGDLDNRLKTLLDALRMPHDDKEARPDEKNPKRTYCVCLFEDDAMVTSFTVDTRPSLRPMPRGHVELTIDVELKSHDLTFQDE